MSRHILAKKCLIKLRRRIKSTKKKC